MIAYFPKIYPDELFYSIIARYHLHSGNMYYKNTFQDLFNYKKQLWLDIRFVDKLSSEIITILKSYNLSIEDIILKHTMYPLYGRFLPLKRREEAYNSLLSMHGDFSKKLGIYCCNEYLRYCPLCVEEDRKIYGETYWHREHQITHICPIHGCYLIESTILINTSREKNLVSAEECITNLEVRYSSEKEIRLTQYAINVFQSPLYDNSSIKDFFRIKLMDTPYLSIRGESECPYKLWKDLQNFYQGIFEFTVSRVNSVLKGTRKNFLEICLISMFLNISEEELVKMDIPNIMPEQQFDEKIQNMLAKGLSNNQIAKELKISPSIVRLSIDNSKKEKQDISRKKKKNSKVFDWETLDEKSLPIVQKAIQDIKKSSSRISYYAISKRTNIQSHRLKKMSTCKQMIECNLETEEEYHARKIIWGINQMGEYIKCWELCHKIKIEKDEIQKALPFIKKENEKIAKIVEKIIS